MIGYCFSTCLKTVADLFFEAIQDDNRADQKNLIHRGQSSPDPADWKRQSLVKCPHNTQSWNYSMWTLFTIHELQHCEGDEWFATVVFK